MKSGLPNIETDSKHDLSSAPKKNVNNLFSLSNRKYGAPQQTVSNLLDP